MPLQCRRLLLMPHERVEGLEGFKRKYDALKAPYDAKAAEVSQLQQQLTTASLGQAKVSIDDIKRLGDQLGKLTPTKNNLERELEESQ